MLIEQLLIRESLWGDNDMYFKTTLQ